MAKLGTVLERQFKKLGIDITDELRPLIAADLEVPEEIARKIDTGLLTIDSAKSNSEVNKALRTQILAGADSKMYSIIQEMGLTVGDDFLNEKNTYEKISLLSKMVNQHGLKKGEGNSKGELSETLRKERESFLEKENFLKKQVKELASTRANDRTEFALHKKLLGKDYVFPKDMDNDIKVSTAMSVINTKLKSIGAIANLNDAGQLVITDKDGNKAFNERHEAIDDVDSFFDGVLTHNKLLKINDSTNPQQQSSQGSGGAGNNFIANNNAARGNQGIVNEIDAQLKSML